MDELTIRPVHGIGEIRPGDDLAARIAGAAPWLADGDVLVVTSKIISKAEGNLVDVPPSEGPERERAREDALRTQTARDVASRGQTRIVQTHHGFVLAAAGIDASNIDRGHLVLLPADPDGSAHALRAALRQRTGKDVAVIISDTMGRPWRLGLTDVAIGAAGIGALRDHRGEADAHGNLLQITQVAVVDELAAAGELVKGKADQVPVAVIRGYAAKTVGEGARALVRPATDDLFSTGTAEARADGLRAAATLPEDVEFIDAPMPPQAIDRALSIVEIEVRRLDPSDPDVSVHFPASTKMILAVEAETARAGAAIHRLRAALAAEGLASVWRDDQIAVGVPRGSR